MQLCNLDWLDFDLETKKLFHMMLVGATTDKMCKIGSLKINLESFSKVRIKILHQIAFKPSHLLIHSSS